MEGRRDAGRARREIGSDRQDVGADVPRDWEGYDDTRQDQLPADVRVQVNQAGHSKPVQICEYLKWCPQMDVLFYILRDGERKGISIIAHIIYTTALH